MNDVDPTTGLVRENDGMRIVCPRCMVRSGLYKEIHSDNTLSIHCGTCGWKTKKLPRESHHNERTKHLPDMHEFNRKADGWK